MYRDANRHQAREYSIRNRARISAYQAQYQRERYQSDPEYRAQIQRKNKAWRALKHSSDPAYAAKVAQRALERQRHKYRTDPEFRRKSIKARAVWLANLPANHSYKLGIWLRVRMHKALNRNIGRDSAVTQLGCTVDFFRDWVQEQFQPGMTWGNFGSVWQLDHIKALGLFDLTDPEQFALAAHYTNHQPLFTADHRRKTANDLRLIRAQRAGE